jgi:murein DD-endopeptidase MepM/ murein hydrolase activator NlpD
MVTGGEDVAGQFFNRRALLKPQPGIGVVAVIFALVCAGCAGPASGAPTTGSSTYRSLTRRNSGSSTHVVAPGDTVYHLAQTYGVSTESLMAANSMSDPRDLRVGQLLIIPNGENDDAPATAATFALTNPWSVPPADRQFKWPVVAGVVSSPFGMRNGAMHDGVDIAAPAGTPIYAADDGVVIFVGRLHGYGNVVILQHSGGYVTVYGHNQSNLVNQGERVARGQEIAEMGTSGRASGPNLHFEVRYNNQAQNPLAYLPQPNTSTGITFARNGGS